jgi:hypothetical protein
VKKTTLLALAVCAWPVLSLAQDASKPAAAPASAADPAATVPAVQYRALFDAGPKGVVQEMDAWPAANARVGQYPRGHSDILKAEKAQATPRTQGAPAPGVTR